MEYKYYFVYYGCYRRAWNIDGTCQPSNTTTEQAIIDEHPLKWQLECNEKYGPIQSHGGGYTHSENYTVISWQELSREDYDKFKGKI